MNRFRHSERRRRRPRSAVRVLSLIGLMLMASCSPSPEPPGLPPSMANAELQQRIGQARREVIGESGSGPAWGRLGQCFEAAELLSEARVCYARAAVLDPTSARWPHLLGLLELQESPEAALGHLARAMPLAGPTNDAPRVRLAQALVERGRFADATNLLASLLQSQPLHPAARLELARVRLAEGQGAQAAELLTPCLTNPYTARPAALLLSQVRAREGDNAAAAALASKAASMPRPFDWPDPFQREVQDLRQDRARTVERVNFLMIQRRLPDAESLLQPLVERYPDDSEVLLVLGRLRLQQGQCTEAERVLGRHLEVQPRSLNGYIQLGLAFMCQSRWGDAAVTFGRAVEVKPDFAQAHVNLAVARSRAGDGAGAIRSLQAALRCSPGEARTHRLLAEELERGGQPQEAAHHRDRARILGGESGRTADGK